MNPKIKDFLKPDRNKLLLSIVIFAVLPLPGKVYLCPAPVSGPVQSQCSSSWMILPLGLVLTEASQDYIVLPGPVLLLAFVFYLASYFISCALIWLWPKIRK